MPEQIEGEADGPGKPVPVGERTSLSLLEQVRQNDRGAWERLTALYGPLVEFWCRRAGLSLSDAEDVAQEVFSAAARGLGGFRRDRPGDSFRGWLRGITRNQMLVHFRRNRGEPRAEGGSESLNRLREHPDPIGIDITEEEESSELNRLYLRALDQIRDGFEEKTWRCALTSSLTRS